MRTNYWNKHDALMNELDGIYKKTSIKTQNNIQELIDTFKFNQDNLYKIADTKTKRRINNYIDDWKDKGYLKDDYFKVLCNNIYNRINVKNSEILEVLIYSCYIEEQINLDEKEQQTLYEDASYYYQEGIKEVYKARGIKKKPSVIPMTLFLILMEQQSYNGFTFEQNVKTTLYSKVQQTYKQALEDIQQDRDVDLTNDEYKRIFNIQNNQRLSVNKDKISGSMDLTGISLNNKAKVEGIKKEDENAEVIFIAVEDDRTTPMCNSMYNMIFYVDKENEFDRYWGETQKDTKIIHVKVKGLVTGVNLPPIDHFFHFCRSTISYNFDNTNAEMARIADIYNKALRMSKLIGMDVSDDIDKFSKLWYDNKSYSDELATKLSIYKDYEEQVEQGDNKVTFEKYYQKYITIDNKPITTKDDVEIGEVMPHAIYKMAQRNINYKDIREALLTSSGDYNTRNDSFVYVKGKVNVAVANDDKHNIKTVFIRRK